ncbi:ABC transporter ATP-binding protein [Niveibacterium sp. SC-1]|uniref:ABC transporter ATP-binding protein n=1 Tax=Niveibacterium sp. SC-1 TaxID=3135646 RepID=UPI00311DB0CC
MSLLQLALGEKRFGAKPVLRDLQLGLDEGEVLAVVGASGGGKSTLLRILAGLDRDYAGTLRLDGRALTGVTRDIGFVFQEPRLLPWLTVAQNVAFDAAAGEVDATWVEILLREVGLAGYGASLPKALSGGQAQRVAIARGLYRRPRILLLDEPFSAVDPFTRQRLQALLADVLREHGITAVIVTHDVVEAVRLADTVLVLGERPATVAARIRVTLPREQRQDTLALQAIAQEVLAVLEAAHAFQ